MTAPDAIQLVLKTLEDDQPDLIDLCLAIGNLPDYSGHERASGEAVASWLQDAGIEAWLQHISSDSVNAVGVLRGVDDTRDRTGRSLIFNAHIDTQGGVPAGGEAAEQRIRGAWLEGDLLYGQGLANDKAQLAAEMLAMRRSRKLGSSSLPTCSSPGSRKRRLRRSTASRRSRPGRALARRLVRSVKDLAAAG